MLCSSNDLKKYKEYYENILNGNIVSFDEELINKLKTHKNKSDKSMKDFMSAIVSYSNGGSTYLKSRYLKQFLNDEYKVCDGYINGFEEPLFHSWIENDEVVYDILFIGVWPKELYYQVMNPVVTKVMDENDKEYLRIISNTVSTEADNKEFG